MFKQSQKPSTEIFLPLSEHSLFFSLFRLRVDAHVVCFGPFVYFIAATISTCAELTATYASLLIDLYFVEEVISLRKQLYSKLLWQGYKLMTKG